MKLAYYPGCVARSTGREYEISTLAVCRALGVELEEIDDWNCCGATHVSNEVVSTALAARNLVRTSLPVMTSCSICYSRLRAAMIRLKDRHMKKRVNEALEVKYEEAKEVQHVIETITGALSEVEDPEDITVISFDLTEEIGTGVHTIITDILIRTFTIILTVTTLACISTGCSMFPDFSTRWVPVFLIPMCNFN